MKSLLAKIAGFSSAIFNFYAPILKSVFASGAAALLPLALEIVRALADSDRTGGQKREAAVKALTKAATERGIEAAESVIRFTIESAVQKLKTEE